MPAPHPRRGPFRRHLATTVTALLGAALAVPAAASADHFAGVSGLPGGPCFTAAFTSSLGFSFTTLDWTLRIRGSGEVDLRCRFEVPASWTAWDGAPRTRPKRFSEAQQCAYVADVTTAEFTTGEFRIRPNGDGTLRCRWPAPPADAAPPPDDDVRHGSTPVRVKFRSGFEGF